jgi:hypothetical protein
MIEKQLSNVVNQYKQILSMRVLTIQEWDEMQSKIPIDTIKKEFFDTNCSFNEFNKVMRMQKLAKLNDTETVKLDEGEEKNSTLTDHNPVFATNKVSIGSSKLESEINSIYATDLKEKGLDENQIRHVLSIIISVQKSDKDSAKEQMMKVIRKFCIQNNFRPEFSDALGQQALRISKELMTKGAKNLAEILTEVNEEKKKRKFKRVVKSIGQAVGVAFDEISETQYELASTMKGRGN